MKSIDTDPIDVTEAGRSARYARPAPLMPGYMDSPSCQAKPVLTFWY